MKIDEGSINHNALRLIHELDIWDITGNGMQDFQIMTLGYIRGITELAEALKEVLRA